MVARTSHQYGYVELYEVFTAAAGFKMRYGKDIKHITYGLTDHKSENISSYFDMAAYQINKSMGELMFRFEIGECTCALRCWSIKGTIHNI